MNRDDWKGDFLGFTFGGVHSSSLGIVRVSDGDRYNESLNAEFEDKVVKPPGRDETYYFGSEYKQKIFEIQIAFEEMTDIQFRRLKQLMNNIELKELIFDEFPYKVYTAKPNGTSDLKYLCFDNNGQRIYKGEGTLNFVAYFPFARSRFRWIEEYIPKNIPEWKGINENNKKDWLKSSRLPSKNKTYSGRRFEGDTVRTRALETVGNDGKIIFIVNPGDLPADIKFLVRTYNYNTHYYQISLNKVVDNDYTNPERIAYFNIKDNFSYMEGFYVDSYNSLITSTENGHVANGLITKGKIFKIPPSLDNEYYYIAVEPSEEDSQPSDSLAIQEITEYNYLYY